MKEGATTFSEDREGRGGAFLNLREHLSRRTSLHSFSWASCGNQCSLSQTSGAKSLLLISITLRGRGRDQCRVPAQGLLPIPHTSASLSAAARGRWSRQGLERVSTAESQYSSVKGAERWDLTESQLRPDCSMSVAPEENPQCPSTGAVFWRSSMVTL